MNILVLGSEGFIGSHVIKNYIGNANVYGCDLVEYPTQDYNYTKLSRLNPDYTDLFKNKKYDYCINAAGNGSVPVSIEKPLLDFDANCYDVIRILELIKEHNNTCRYLHLSSAAVYGNPSSLPIYEDALLHPLSPYGWHKLIAEKLCEEYCTLYNLSVAVVRPFSVYGPGLRKQLIWDMAQKAKKADGQPVELWGDGEESRDFIYIEDLVNAIDLVLKNCNAGKIQYYNLAAGIETTIKEVATVFYKELGQNISFRFNNNVRPGDPRNWRAATNKLTELGFEIKYPLEKGLKLTAEWIKELL